MLSSVELIVCDIAHECMLQSTDEMSLCDNSIEGAVPSEIGLLTNLGRSIV